MLNSIQANNKVIIASLDKLSGNYKDSKEIIQIITDKRKEYFFVTLKIFLVNPLLFYFLLFFSYAKAYGKNKLSTLCFRSHGI